MEDLRGKVAIVTGASRGLGRAIALKLSKERAKVVIADILDGKAVQQAIEDRGGTAMTLMLDVSDENATNEMVSTTVDRFGGVDILVNNAAIGLTKKTPLFEISAEEWDRVMAVNIKGYWLCARAVFPHMKSKGMGKIINILSDTFFTGSHQFVHYVTTKGGVVGLTRSLARELGDYGICINAVAPGFLANEAGLAVLGGDLSKFDLKQNCIKRVGTPNDIVGAVAFFASTESDFITGQTLIVNGGRVMH